MQTGRHTTHCIAHWVAGERCLTVHRAPLVDHELHHQGRPLSSVEAFYRLLFSAWEKLGWGHDTQEGFQFQESTATIHLPGDLQFHVKVRRTCSVLDLDRTAKVYGITAENIHSLIRRVPGVQLSVHHILDTHLEPERFATNLSGWSNPSLWRTPRCCRIASFRFANSSGFGCGRKIVGCWRCCGRRGMCTCSCGITATCGCGIGRPIAWMHWYT